MNFCFLLNINYHFVRSLCFCNGLILSFIETYPSFKHFKISEFKDLLKQHAALAFCRNQIEDLSILTKTHINHDEIHYIRSNWLSFIPSFSPMRIVIQKDCLTSFMWVLKVSLRLTLI